MKKILLFLLFAFPAVTVHSQAMINIDSIKVLPAVPSAFDPVYLHIYGWCSYGAALDAPPTVLHAGFSHAVDACYIVNVLAVITDIHDSVYLFTGPVGTHSVYWNITQNADQLTPVCDTQVTSGSATVYVNLSDIDESSLQPYSVYWNPEDHTLAYAFPGATGKTFSVYTMNGQLLAKEQAIAENGKIALPTDAAGLYIVTLEDENGVLLRRKIYCR